jgi:YVTN family beta-propeller protein
VPSENAHIELDGKPMAIGVIGDRIYVVIQPSNSTSVIEATNSTKMANTTVGDGPMAIGVNEVRNMVYVANYGSDTVSAINGYTNTKVGPDIKVGHLPMAIAVNQGTGMVYVANYGSNTLFCN